MTASIINEDYYYIIILSSGQNVPTRLPDFTVVLLSVLLTSFV